MKLLQTKDLTIGYKRPKITDKILQQNINVSINPGEIISLMGQNGVGKTTFVKTISGLIPSLGGEVWFQERSLKVLDRADLATKLSVVLTEKPYAQNLSVVELIAMGRHPYSGWMGSLSEKDKEVINWAITETHINYLANYKLYELSDGQLQKVMIARALAQETDLIVLDEPAAHLDLYNKIEVMLLLRKIAEKGKGILISTHDMQISTQLSDKLWLFNFNEPVHEGTPEDLILNGTLERSLYLSDYHYDMIYGALNQPFEPMLTVSLEGPKEYTHWTCQALKRNQIGVLSEAKIKISISENQWHVLHQNGEIVCNSINEVLISLKKLYQHSN